MNLAINCTEPPFPVYQNDLGMSNWTGVDGVDPRPYATEIVYYCRREGWGYPSNGDNETTIQCNWDGQWSNDQNIESCVSKYHGHQDCFITICLSELPCPSQPPDVLPGEGAERNYGMEITTYRCPNGYEWVTGDWPYLEVECLNKKWSRTTLPDCRSKIKYY